MHSAMHSTSLMHGQHAWHQCQRMQQCQQRASCAQHRPHSSRRAARMMVQAAEAMQLDEERIKEVRQEATRRIKALGEANKVREAIQELAGLSKLGVQPDTQAGTALVAACSRRDMTMAQSVFDELFGDFLTPDEVTFAVLLRGYGASKPPAWTKIDAVLTRMRQEYGMTPSATSYNALLEVCIRTNDIDRGMDVLDRMASDGVAPDDLTDGIVSRKRTLRSYFKKRVLGLSDDA